MVSYSTLATRLSSNSTLNTAISRVLNDFLSRSVNYISAVVFSATIWYVPPCLNKLRIAHLWCGGSFWFFCNWIFLFLNRGWWQWLMIRCFLFEWFWGGRGFGGRFDIVAGIDTPSLASIHIYIYIYRIKVCSCIICVGFSVTQCSGIKI